MLNTIKSSYKSRSPTPTPEDQEESDDSSLSIPDENIDFNLVYTLYTFEATVNGQASVKKGDALSLLDDSNSYWWLIKDLGTSEIGYIPAENIETPFERLARLNKYRNLEITSQMTHYIKKEKKRLKKKKVSLSTRVQFQLEVILTDEEENKEETVYETWTSEMSLDSLFLDSVSDDDDDDSSSQQTLTEETLWHVLRVYAGNLNVAASYHSIRVTENISAAELLSRAKEKFHIPQIDVHHNRESIEYYLTIKNKEGEEIMMQPEDKPCAIYETLNSHLTMPMPPIKQTRSHRKKKRRHQYEQVQFLLHKRIRRRSEGGLIHVKLCLLLSNHFSQLTRKKDMKGVERIDKLVAIRDTITVNELTQIAFEKFHIKPHESQKYSLLLHTKKNDTLLNNNFVLSDILKTNNEEEKQFILYNRTQPYNHNPIQVTVTVDRVTQAILKRVDTALAQQPIENNKKFTMSVSRNDQNGIDIHLPHGLLRSRRLSQNKTHYSLMTSVHSVPIFERILPETIRKDESIVSAKELEILVQYGIHSLNSLESKYSHFNIVN
ncbi:hypothetical protein G6F37_006004 [Rhizopus arrhizus]|nr:hypothetical protein G6F38_007877 [Rhizopus arrhizus]KAG1158210.1 hypothetical protein G6F37_006004 [Rhizopus arrhizus]